MTQLATAALAAFALASGAAAQLVPLFPSNSAQGDAFGAAIAIEGGRLVVGSALPAGPSLIGGTQAVYVFERAGSAWIQDAILAPVAAGFGAAVALEGDRIVIGAPNDATTGSVFVFERGPSGWAQAARVVASDAFQGQIFGTELALEGDRFVATSTDAAYVFELQPTGWTQIQRLDSADGVAMGNAVALWGDTLAVGAETDALGGSQRGSVYVFERLAGTWSQTAKLVHAAPFDSQRFGASLDLEGDRIVVGAQPVLFSFAAGAVTELARGPGGWSAVAEIPAPAGALAFEFGASVALAGNSLLVGSPNEPAQSGFSGTAYLFRRAGGGWQVETLLDDPAPVSSSRYGDCVAYDGDRAAIGAPSLPIFTPVAGHVGTVDLFVGGLSGTPGSISLSAGGTQSLVVNAPPSVAGQPYLLLGSLTGTAPGIPLDGLVIPLNVDGYTIATLLAPNAPPLAGSFGLLGPNGDALASFTLPPGAAPQLAGFTVAHAYVVFSLPPQVPVAVFVSEAETVDLVP